MPTEKEVIEVLKQIIDPHTDISVYDMGLITELEATKSGVKVVYRPTSPFCPLGLHLAENMKRRLREMKGVKKVEVRITGHLQEDSINRLLAEKA